METINALKIAVCLNVMFTQTYVAFLKTLVLACLINRDGTTTGRMATARSLITVDAAGMTIALTQNRHVAKLVMLFRQLV